jgi:hypothetical protein
MAANDSPDSGPLVMSILRDPASVFLRHWNWKAALLSAVGRSPVFLVTTYSFGWRSATLAVAVETAYRAGTAGLFAAFTQVVRNKRPIWLAITLITVAIPVVSLGLDCLVHLTMRTPNLGVGILISFIISAATSLFNWYSMRHGTLLVGREQDRFVNDLRRMPKLILGFLLVPPAWMWRCTRQVLATCGGHHDN